MAEDASRVKALFQEALERPAAERDAFLDAQCGDDDDLRTKVYTLLQALEAAGSFLAESPGTVVGEEPGTLIDRYKLLQRIGEGGFGVVWMAEQTRPVRRKVALKIIKVGMDTKQVVARFDAERQALAMMDHPSIAKVLDAGATTTGRPYFVMELVRGVPITEYCDQVRLEPRARIELFTRVCHAAQHAHHKGVIHRDLKPGNILVTLQDGEPVPKVIDFGIAKATAQELTQKTLFTEFKQMIGTPEYLAPEQAEMSGLDVDTRADVYSLGVTLYELLTGARPFEVDPGRGYVELLRQVVETEPTRPSTRLGTLGGQLSVVASNRRTEPRKLQRLMRGDLDWILMTALAKDRRRRYPTASAFMEDLQRHLDGLPIAAGRPGALYRGLKFCQRHRYAVGAAMVFAALLVVTAAISAGFAIESGRAKDLAEQQSYIANIIAAEAALRDQDSQGARLRLAETAEHLRGWEWQFLNGRVDRSSWTAGPDGSKVSAMAFHPRDPAIATAWVDGTLRVHDTVTGRPLRDLGRDRGPATSLAFDASGSTLYAGGTDGSLTALNWRQRTGVPLTGHGDNVVDLDLSPDGRTLASASWDGSVKLWDTASSSLSMTLPHEAAVHRVAWSADGRTLASASWDQTFTLWDATRGEMLVRRAAASPETEIVDARRWTPGRIEDLAIDPGSRWLATGCRDGSLAVWDVRTGAPVFRQRAHEGLIRALAWSPDSGRLAVASYDRTLSLWDTGGWVRIGTLLGHSDDVRSVAFHPRGETFASVSWDRSVKLWRTRDGALRGTMLGHGEGIYRVRFSSDGAHLATFAEDGTLKLWETRTGFLDSIHAQTAGGFVHAVAFAMHDLLATSDTRGPVRIWNLQTVDQRIDPILHGPGTSSLAMHAPGFMLATTASENDGGKSDHDIRLWDLRTQTVLRTLSGHQGLIRRVVFSADGSSLASASDDGTVRIWDVETGAERLRVAAHDGWVRDVAFAPSGRIVSCSDDGTAAVWHPTTGELLGRIDCGSAVYGLAIHPDAGLLALACENRTIFLYDLRTTALRATLRGHAGPVTSLAWLPDGSRLVSGSEDRTVRLWDPDSRANVATLQGHTRQVRTVAVSSDGSTIASGGEDNVVRLWNRHDR